MLNVKLVAHHVTSRLEMVNFRLGICAYGIIINIKEFVLMNLR